MCLERCVQARTLEFTMSTECDLIAVRMHATAWARTVGPSNGSTEKDGTERARASTTAARRPTTLPPAVYHTNTQQPGIPLSDCVTTTPTYYP